MLLMEYMPLGNLKHQHRQNRFLRAELKVILRQVLDAVVYLHGKGRVHRDLKPENILLQMRDPPLAKISDFGLATRDGFLATECGTKKYAAPEIYKGRYDKSVDIWSIGVSIFDIIEDLPNELGELSHENWAAKVQRRVTKAYKDRADPFLQLIKEMLNIESTARPTAEACFWDSRLDVSLEDDQFDLNDIQYAGQDLVTTTPGSPTEIIDVSRSWAVRDLGDPLPRVISGINRTDHGPWQWYVSSRITVSINTSVFIVLAGANYLKALIRG